MKKLFIHIGRAKTGTSALQSFLAANRDALSRLGYKYADTAFFCNTHHPLAWSLHKEAFDCSGGRYWRKASMYARLSMSPEEYFAALRDEIEDSPEHSFVISSEEFGVVLDLHLTAPLLARHLEGLAVKFIVYFRRQDDFLQSLYNQAVKGDEERYTGDFWSYVNPILEVGGADCMKVLTPLSESFSDNAISVRVYEKEQLKENIFIDFLDTLGIADSVGFDFPKAPQNLKLDARFLPVVRELNRIPMAREVRDEILNTLRSKSEGSGPFADHGILSPRERFELLQRFEESNAIVARRFLGRANGMLFIAPSPDPEQNPVENNITLIEDAIEALTDFSTSNSNSISAIKEILRR